MAPTPDTLSLPNNPTGTSLVPTTNHFIAHNKQMSNENTQFCMTNDKMSEV
jgi:hypothetical protein